MIDRPICMQAGNNGRRSKGPRNRESSPSNPWATRGRLSMGEQPKCFCPRTVTSCQPLEQQSYKPSGYEGEGHAETVSTNLHTLKHNDTARCVPGSARVAFRSLLSRHKAPSMGVAAVIWVLAVHIPHECRSSHNLHPMYRRSYTCIRRLSNTYDRHSQWE